MNELDGTILITLTLSQFVWERRYQLFLSVVFTGSFRKNWSNQWANKRTMECFRRIQTERSSFRLPDQLNDEYSEGRGNIKVCQQLMCYISWENKMVISNKAIANIDHEIDNLIQRKIRKNLPNARYLPLHID